MATTPLLDEGHFNGGRNLYPGTNTGTEKTLAQLVNLLRADVVTLEAVIAGLKDPKDSVLLATAAALPACTAAGTGAGKTLTGDANGQLTVDGTALVAGHVGARVLVKNQVAGKDNGLYVVTAPGTAGTPFILTRATDADSDDEVTAGMTVAVETGTANADTIWMLTTDNPITVDTTALTFTSINPNAHASLHILGAADEIDGDRLDIDMAPNNYAPNAGEPTAGNADHLSAHLSGIDNEIATINARTSYPDIRGTRAAGGTLAANGSEALLILGADLLQGQPFAQATLGASLDIIAEEPGSPGNALSVEIIDSGGVGGLAVSYAAGKLTIDLDGDTPTEDQIATAVNTTGTWDGIFRANSGGGAAFGAVAETSLTGGGTGLGCKAYVGGGLARPVGEAGAGATSNASLSEASMNVMPADMTGLSPALQAADEASVWVESNGLRSNTGQAVLV